MRSANHVALMRLRLEGYEVIHRKKTPICRHDARWLVVHPSTQWHGVYRSPSEAAYILLECKEVEFSYDAYGIKHHWK